MKTGRLEVTDVVCSETTKAGRPKGTKVGVCLCGWRVTGKGKTARCTACGRRTALDKKQPRNKAPL
jgi:hypothetical protein